MKTKRLFFDARKVVDRAIADRRTTSLHAAAQRAGVSYPTVHGWYNRPPEDSNDKIQMSKLYTFLTVGLDMTDDDLLDLRIGDIFKVVEVDDRARA